MASKKRVFMYFPSACATRIRSDHFRYKWRELSRLRLISCNSWERQEWDGSAQQLRCMWNHCSWLGWESIHFFIGEASCGASGLWDLAMGEWYDIWNDIKYDMIWIELQYEMIWTEVCMIWNDYIWQDGKKSTMKWLYEMTLRNDCMTWLYEMTLWHAFIYRELANSVHIIWKLQVIEPKRTSLFMVLVDTICTDFYKK